MRVEVLIDEPLVKRAKRMLEAMALSGPPGVSVTSHFIGKSDLLMLYGVGHPNRMSARKRQLRAGGRSVMWDMGYWERKLGGMRLTVDSFHPTPAQIARVPGNERQAIPVLREDADPDGPILLVGLGKKSGVMLGIRQGQWERAALDRIRERFPDRAVRWRPKSVHDGWLPDTEYFGAGSIEEALKGCSLVVCRHSNVAVDACIAGVPVECEDGAAAALYASGSNPTSEQRAVFLRRLTWFNWRPSEAAEAWKTIGWLCD